MFTGNSVWLLPPNPTPLILKTLQSIIMQQMGIASHHEIIQIFKHRFTPYV